MRRRGAAYDERVRIGRYRPPASDLLNDLVFVDPQQPHDLLLTIVFRTPAYPDSLAVQRFRLTLSEVVCATNVRVTFDISKVEALRVEVGLANRTNQRSCRRKLFRRLA
jgi:hypothetical protein